MKYKITNISEPINDIEQKMVKDAKDFNRSLIGLVAAESLGWIGYIAWSTTLNSGSYSMIPIALGMFIQTISHGVLSSKLLDHLRELYNRKGNEMTKEIETEEKDAEISGGKQR